MDKKWQNMSLKVHEKPEIYSLHPQHRSMKYPRSIEKSPGKKNEMLRYAWTKSVGTMLEAEKGSKDVEDNVGGDV